MVYMLQCGIKSPRATQRLMCNPGVVSLTLTCFYASAAVNWFENKVNQFTAARTPYEPGLHKAAHVMRYLPLQYDNYHMELQYGFSSKVQFNSYLQA
jgi:hypothetical protein